MPSVGNVVLLCEEVSVLIFNTRGPSGLLVRQLLHRAESLFRVVCPKALLGPIAFTFNPLLFGLLDIFLNLPVCLAVCLHVIW